MHSWISVCKLSVWRTHFITNVKSHILWIHSTVSRRLCARYFCKLLSASLSIQARINARKKTLALYRHLAMVKSILCDYLTDPRFIIISIGYLHYAHISIVVSIGAKMVNTIWKVIQNNAIFDYCMFEPYLGEAPHITVTKGFCYFKIF